MAVKTKKKRTIKVSNKKNKMSWDGWEELTGEQFHRKRRDAIDYYYSEHKTADLIPNFIDWMKHNEYSKEDIRCAKLAPNTHFTTAAIMAKCLADGMPDYNEKHNEFWQGLAGTSGDVKPVSESLHVWAAEAIKRGSKEVEVKEEETKPSGPVKTIQDRMREASAKMCEGIEDHVDELFSNPKEFDLKGVKIINILRQVEAKAAHARVIKALYERERQEFEELLNYPTAAQLGKMSEEDQDMWAQLKEGYAHLDKSSVKKIVAFYDEVLSACDMLATSQKVARKPRKPKEINKEKVVSKLNYLKEDTALKLVSLNPAEIIGSNELWVYNTKTRKIGKYVAANIDPTGQGRAGSGLSVKGTTIQGFNEAESIQKTLRKPDEQLAEFKSAGKVALRKYLDNIKAVDIKLNGRINADIILLKVSK